MKAICLFNRLAWKRDWNSSSILWIWWYTWSSPNIYIFNCEF